MTPTATPGPLITAAIYVQALPVIAYALTRRRTIAVAWITLGGAITVLSTMIGVEVARLYGNNLIVGYVAIPLTAAAYLMALSSWQATYVERMTMRIGLILFAIIYVMLVRFLEDVTHFGQYSHTLYALVLLVAALWTLGRRAFTQDEALALDTDWFWVAFGLAMYGAATAITAAIGNILLARQRVDLFVRAWDVRGALVILAFLAISWGVLHGPPKNESVDLKP